ncbi:F-box domain, phloem protein 2-like protein, partial [Tanacetum coccineum]
VFSAAWAIWSNRNQREFAASDLSLELLIEVQHQAFGLGNSRLNRISLAWKNWINCSIGASNAPLSQILLYAHLLCPLSFKLDKKNGKKSYMLGIMELNIEGQDDPKCWTWSPKSRFPKVGILEDVDQIKIRASIPAVLLSRKSTYVAYLVFRIVGVSLDLQKPTKRMGSYAGREIDQSIVYLQRPSVHCIQRYWQKNGALPRKRGDGWKEIKLGEFYSDEGEDGEFVMAFEEIRDEFDTSALIVEGIDLRPK